MSASEGGAYSSRYLGLLDGNVVGTVLDKANEQLYITKEISKGSYLGFRVGVIVGRPVEGVDVGSPGRGVGISVGVLLGVAVEGVMLGA